MKFNFKIISLVAALLMGNQVCAAQKINAEEEEKELQEIKQFCAKNTASLNAARMEAGSLLKPSDDYLRKCSITDIEELHKYACFLTSVSFFQKIEADKVFSEFSKHEPLFRELKKEIFSLLADCIRSAQTYSNRLAELKTAQRTCDLCCKCKNEPNAS